MIGYRCKESSRGRAIKVSTKLQTWGSVHALSTLLAAFTGGCHALARPQQHSMMTVTQNRETFGSTIVALLFLIDKKMSCSESIHQIHLWLFINQLFINPNACRHMMACQSGCRAAVLARGRVPGRALAMGASSALFLRWFCVGGNKARRPPWLPVRILRYYRPWWRAVCCPPGCDC